MAHKKVHSDRLGRICLSRRAVGILVACALLSLVWYNAGNGRLLRENFNSLSKQAEKYAAPAAIVPDSDDRPDVDAQLRNATLPPKNVSSQAPFPPLPPPDIEEYMAISMAGEYL